MSFFNAKEESAKLNDFSPLPDGMYKVCLTDIDMKEDKQGVEYIAVTYEVSEGEYKNRKLFDNLYLKSQYESLERNSRAKLKLLCETKGIETLSGPSDLNKFIGHEVYLKVVYNEKKGDDGTIYKRNFINDIRAPKVAPPPPPPKAPSLEDDVPWK